MTFRTLFLGLGAVASLAPAAFGQPATAPAPPQPGQPPRATAPAPAAPGARPRRTGQPVNVKIDVTVTDQRGGTAVPLKKTITIVVADAMDGRIRSSAESTNGFSMPLNVDAEPEILNDGKIRLRLNLQYDLPTATGGEERSLPTSVGALRRTQLQENLALVLENDKVMVVAQSADPIGDRQVTFELKATILR
jgi:hypothetical protein